MEEDKISRREMKKIQSRKAILDSAASLFQSRGLEDVAIADIMSGADLGIGTFYNYFDSKDDVLMELLGRIMKELGERVRVLSEERRPVTEILRELLLAAARLLGQNRYVLPLFLLFNHAHAVENQSKLQAHVLLEGNFQFTERRCLKQRVEKF